MAKIYTVEKKINGKNYVFQHNGVSAWLKAMGSFYEDGTSNISPFKYHSYLLENVVVSPKMEIDDFTSSDELSEVTAFAKKVASGEIQPDKPAEKK